MQKVSIQTTALTSAFVTLEMKYGRKKIHRHVVSFSLRQSMKGLGQWVAGSLGFETKEDADLFIALNSENQNFQFAGYKFVEKFIYE